MDSSSVVRYGLSARSGPTDGEPGDDPATLPSGAEEESLSQQTGTFREWLLGQTERQDVVGVLAQKAHSLEWWDRPSLQQALRKAGFLELVYHSEFLPRAIREYESAIDGWIYFISAGSTGPIKIGFSKNVEERLATLQTAHYEKLSLLFKYPGSIRDEQQLHHRFRHARMMGEWFQPESELLTYLDAVCG